MLREMLRPLASRMRDLAAGESLFRRDDPVRALFLVEAGEVHLRGAMPMAANSCFNGRSLARSWRRHPFFIQLSLRRDRIGGEQDH